MVEQVVTRLGTGGSVRLQFIESWRKGLRRAGALLPHLRCTDERSSAVIKPEDEKRACKGGDTICAQSRTCHVEICQACGLAIDCEELDCSFFGFAAVCPHIEEEEGE